MNAKQRNSILRDLLENYGVEKEKNRVWGRENSSSYEYSKGVLIGFLMANELEMTEFQNGVICIRKINSERAVMYYNHENL